MRIFHICHLPDPTNGIFNVLMTLPTEQRLLGHDARVFNIVDGKATNDEVKHASVAELKNLFKSERPDIVVFHGVYYLEILHLSRALQKDGIPYLIELHGSLSRENIRKSRLKKTLARIVFLDGVVKHARAIVYLNENEHINSAINKVNGKSVIIPNGCYPFAEEYPELAVKTPEPNDKFEIIFLGRIDRNHKGLDILFDAMELLKERRAVPNLHLSLYGSGFEEDIQWMRRRLPALAGMADYYGPAYGRDKGSAYLNSDIFILTSRYEGFPVAVLEALSAGLPCLVTPPTNVSDIIEQHRCGWVAALDPTSIADAVTQAANELKSHRNTLRNNAIKTGALYSWRMIAAQSVNTYRSLL